MSRCVLVIDDEPDIRDITRMTLEHFAGWQVLCAENGREGERFALEHHPDAILLDIMMPDLDGEATARLIRGHAETCDIPIVLMSAATEPPSWAAGVGVLGLVAKPFRPATLPDQLRAQLHW